VGSVADPKAAAALPSGPALKNQDLALLGEHLDLAAKAAQLVALGAAQPLGLALVDIALRRPVAKRLRRDTELLGQLRDRPAAGLE
jgi:hypothetical protein